jgi:hypothetical protein
MLNPQAFADVLGSSFVKDYAGRPMLTIGKDQWTRAELARMGVVQTRACSILSSVAKRIGVASLKDLYTTTTLHTITTEYPAASATVFVLFAAFRDRGLDARAWIQPTKDAVVVSILTLKLRELKKRKQERKTERARARTTARRRHERDVSQYLAGHP